VSCLNLNLRVLTLHSMPFCMNYQESSGVSQPVLESDFGNSSMPCEHKNVLRRGSVVVKALRHKLEGRRFET
jgi:hypothetical protein